MSTFPNSIYVISLVGACAATWIAMHYWLSWCLRHDWLDHPGHRKIHDQPIALAGGLAIATSLIIVISGALLLLQLPILSSDAIDSLNHGFGERGIQIVGIVGGIFMMLGIGLWDDRHQPKPAVKFIIQSLAALLVAACGVRVTLFVDSLVFSYAATWFWILLVVNACNFVDNMNGLCAGLAVISAFFFGLHASSQEHYLVASLAFAICGALLGFLPFNYPRARSFLGDSGSHLIGFMMAVLSILPHFYHEGYPHRHAVLSPLIILGIFLLDFAWIITFRTLNGLPVYTGDNNHLSHQMVRRGMAQHRAVAILWLFQIFLGLSSITLLMS